MKDYPGKVFDDFIEFLDDETPEMPYSENENPEQWAKRSVYFEEHIKDAFQAGFDVGGKICSKKLTVHV